MSALSSSATMVQVELTPLTYSRSGQTENHILLNGFWDVGSKPFSVPWWEPGEREESPLDADEPGAASGQMRLRTMPTQEVGPRGGDRRPALLELLDPAVPPLIHEPVNPSFDFNQSMVVSVKYNPQSQRTLLGTFRNKTRVHRNRNCSIR